MTQARDAGPRGFAASTTATDPELVWRRWTDPATWGDWDRGLRSAELDGPFKPGARGTIVGLAGRRSRFTVCSVEPRVRVVIDVPLPAAVMVQTRTLQQGSPGRAEHQITFRGALAGLWVRVLGRRFRPLLGNTVNAVVRPNGDHGRTAAT